MSSSKVMALAAVLALGLANHCFAEISVQPSSSGLELIQIYGKTDDPTPWPNFSPVLPTPILRIVNADGDARGDKYPDFVLRQGFTPAVVWSYWDGQDFEVAYSEWTGAAWSATLLLTNNSTDDLEPKIEMDAAGRPILTWWRAGAPSAVYAMRRTSSASWESESPVSQAAEPARAPTLALPLDGYVRVAYEVREGAQRHIVVCKDLRATPEDPPAYVREVVATTMFDGDSFPVVHTRGSHVWATWVHSDSNVGWSELQNGVWTLPSMEPYSGPEDIEAARFRINNQLGP
jgi:hypothetical protein